MSRLTEAEKVDLIDRIEIHLKAAKTFNPNAEAPTLEELRKVFKVSGKGTTGAFTRLLRNRLFVVGDRVYLSSSLASPKKAESEAPVKNGLSIKKIIKALENMSHEIEALKKENARLRAIKSVPTLSERARKALAVYGD